MHHTVEVLLDLLDVLFCTHEAFHEDVELLVQADDLDSSIAAAIVVEHLLCTLSVFVFFIQSIDIGHVISVAVRVHALGISWREVR